jgi:hypothetical protein
MDITPQHIWILASLGGGVGFLGVGIAMRSFLASRLLPPASPVAKPAVKEAAPMPIAAPSPEQSRLEGRNQILESSHWILQQEMLDLRSKMADQVAQVARETALRVHLEVALGKSHQECDQLRAQIDAARQSHAELTLQKALLDTEITDLKLRLEKALQAVPPPLAPPPAVPPQAAPPESARSMPVPPVRLPAILTHPRNGILSAEEGFPAAEPTVVPVRTKAWSLELQNFRRRTTEKPVKRGKSAPRSRSGSKS